MKIDNIDRYRLTWRHKWDRRRSCRLPRFSENGRAGSMTPQLAAFNHFWVEKQFAPAALGYLPGVPPVQQSSLSHRHRRESRRLEQGSGWADTAPELTSPIKSLISLRRHWSHLRNAKIFPPAGCSACNTWRRELRRRSSEQPTELPLVDFDPDGIRLPVPLPSARPN